MQHKNIDASNERFQLAVQLVNQTNRNIFLTGKAGTGKTTFLKYIREHCAKETVIVAPTGVAAINAGGVTIHSFFQLSFTPFIPENNRPFFGNENETSDSYHLIKQLKLNDDKRKMMRQMELLIIDEVSMVRCDTLDAIDTVLRHIRKRHSEIFGGVQVLFIGDMYQLPPVVKDHEWALLTEYYKGPYFFHSKAVEKKPPVFIEFDKIYRQKDEKFISLLNQVRNNELDKEGLALLEKQFQPNFRRSKNDGYIILTTHNDKARDINLQQLSRLDTKLYSYEAEIKDDFPERNYPAEEILQLKVGAQVMFIRNDSSENGKRFFNGKIGVISKLEEEKIFVKCDDDENDIEVGKEEWENVRYTINKANGQLETHLLGSFIQYPLRLAWGITIHKSQGLSFDKAIIDAGEAFAPGQVYVALSRCTNIEGLVLRSRIRESSLYSDNEIIKFSKNTADNKHLQKELEASRIDFLQSTLIALFNFRNLISNIHDLKIYLIDNETSFNTETIPWIEELLLNMEKLQQIAEKFHGQLFNLFRNEESIESSEPLKERLKAASVYFRNEINIFNGMLLQSPAVTDSSTHAGKYNKALKDIFSSMSLKHFIMDGISENFNIEDFYNRKKNFVLQSFSVNAYAMASKKNVKTAHPVLYNQLRNLRDIICSKNNLPIYLVAGSITLEEMARYLPQTPEELKEISGFGAVKIAQYGEEFLNIINKYSVQNGLSSLINEKETDIKNGHATGTNRKGATQAISFNMFKEGKSIEEIAKERNLVTSTIENHLSHYVESGDIPIEEILSKEKIALIEPFVKNMTDNKIKAVKEQLGDAASYGEIRLVMSALKKEGG